MFSFDTETTLFDDEGFACGELICGSFYTENQDPALVKGIKETCDFVRQILETDEVITGANIAYDFSVVCNHDISLLPLVFKAYDEDRVFDVLIAMSLDAIAKGLLTDDGLLNPRNKSEYLKTSTGAKAYRYSLDLCVREVLKRDNAKENDYWRCRYALLKDLPLSQWPIDAVQYPKDDAINTWQVAQAIINDPKKYENQHNQSEQARAAWALRLGTCWGLRTDKKHNDAIEEAHLEKMKTYIEKYQPLGLIDLRGKVEKQALKNFIVKQSSKNLKPCEHCLGQGKVRSQKSKQRINCEHCDGTSFQLDEVKKTQAGKVATDRDVLLQSPNEQLQKFSMVSQVAKNLTTYIPFLRSCEKHPIHVNANVLLNTGRSSYSGLSQTLPRVGGLRECFVPRPGFLFSSVDYKGLELATFAQCLLWICGESEMAKAINKGLDLHSVVGAQITGQTYADFKAAIDKKDPIVKGYRQGAKPANFGFPGGMGPVTLIESERDKVYPGSEKGFSFCETLDKNNICNQDTTTIKKRGEEHTVCSECLKIVTELKVNWEKAFPEVKKYFNHINEVCQDGRLTQFLSKRIRGGISFCSAANSYFQGLAADGAKKALYRMAQEAYLDRHSPLYGSRIVVFIHDETFLEVPECNAHDAVIRQGKIMADTMREYTPDVLIETEPALMRRWYKEAVAVYDNNGKLIPWEPKEK